MAYVSPTITPSGQTYAQLKAKGFPGYVDGLISANNFNQTTINHIHALVKQSDVGGLIRYESLVHAWLSSMPITGAEMTQRLLDYNTAVKALLAALEEISTLWDANQGTLTTKLDGAGMPIPMRSL